MKHTLMHFECVDSTNNVLKELAAQGAEDGLTVWADTQTAGKGRLGRRWASEKGESATFSVLIRDPAEGMVFRMALACAEAVRALTGADCRVKWPNDVVMGGKKIAGILCESSVSEGKLDYAVCGIGVNLNAEHFPEELPWAGSVKLATGRAVEPGTFIDEFLKQLDLALVPELTDVLKRLAAVSATLGHMVRAGEITGRAERFEPDGSLIVKDDAGEHVIVVGDVSVRGLYGYVD